MNILFISTSIPPCPDMQTTRNMYLIKAMLDAGHKVSIISENSQGIMDTRFKRILEQTAIVRTKQPCMIRIGKVLERNKYLYLAKRVFNVTVNYFVLPDLHMFWDRMAIKAAGTNLSDIDCIVTSSGSYTAHMAGSYLARKNRKVWIAEYGDPWGLNEYGRVKWINAILERWVLKNCTGLVFTTQETIAAYKKVNKAGIPMRLVECGFGDVIRDSALSAEMDRINIAYTGIAYRGSRNLSSAIECIAGRKENLCLNMIGTFSEQYQKSARKGGGNKVKFWGRVSYHRSIQLISEMDILLHIGNRGVMQVPGKTYIYLSSAKPILYIRQEEGSDPTYNLLRKFGGVVCCWNTADSIDRALDELIKNYHTYKKEALERIDSEHLEYYRWKNLGNRFLDFLEESIQNRKKEK